MRDRLSLRVGAAVAVTCALLLIVGGVAAWYVHRLEKVISDRLAEDLPKVRVADEITASARDLQLALTRYLVTSDRKALQVAPEILSSLRSAADRADALADDGDKAWITNLQNGIADVQSQLDHVKQLDDPAAIRSAVEQLNDRWVPESILRPAGQYQKAKSAALTTASEQNQQTADRVALVLLLLGVCGGVAGLLAGFAIARRVHRALVKLQIPVRDATGKLAEVVGPIDVSSTAEIEHLDAVLRDMSSQIAKVVDRLHASQRELLRNEQASAIGQLAAGMAHELRNPLTTMKILVQSALEQGPAGSINGRDLIVLQEEIGRQERSLTAFVDFARPPKPHFRLIDAGEVIDQTLLGLADQAERQGIELCPRISNERLLVSADREQFRQVLVNLLLNAFDAMPDGGTVTITASSLAQLPYDKSSLATADLNDGRSLGWLQICIADTGPGISAELGNRIFEPFISTKETGVGLGLSICRQTVTAHGGQIRVANRSGGGAEFIVHLPLAAEPVMKPSAARPAASREQAEQSRAGQPTTAHSTSTSFTRAEHGSLKPHS